MKEEIERELEKRENDGGVVRLAEIIRAREEANGRDRSSGDGATRGAETGSTQADTAGVTVPGDSEEDADPPPQIREALEILSDMITLQP